MTTAFESGEIMGIVIKNFLLIAVGFLAGRSLFKKLKKKRRLKREVGK